MNWPTITQRYSCPLSECVGSTEGSLLVKEACLDSYTSFAAIISNYTIPIYHIDYEEQTDIKYDCKGRRTTYLKSITISVWTFVGENTHVVHIYYININRDSKQISNCSYEYSYSPLESHDECELDKMNEKECTYRMLSL